MEQTNLEQTFNHLNYINTIKISPDEYLLPLFEVIVNSIQSIEDKENKENGLISIKAIRKPLKTLEMNDEPPTHRPIIGFEVQDNGVGFIDNRFKAFKDAYTDYNVKKGCKGVGRYTVLACFGSMDVDSTFYENGEWQNRRFRFANVKSNVSERIKSNNSELKTIVRLNNYKKAFLDHIENKTVELKEIAENIIQHCLLYFLGSSMPQIYLYDEFTSSDPIFLNDIFRSVIKFDKAQEPLKIDKIKTEFNLYYLRNYSNKTHSFHLCANNREVGKKTNISTYIPSFTNSLIDSENKKYYISIYVTGKFLDESANNQRNEFSIPFEEKNKKEGFDIISLEELFYKLSSNVRKKYSEIIDTADNEKKEKIRNYILNPDKPRLIYKHLLSLENAFDEIPGNASNERIEAELAKKVFQLEQKRTKAFNKAFNRKKYDKEEFGKIITDVLREEAAFSKDKLADLMVSRKSVIKLFRQYLKWRSDENYMLEEELHNIIFTMGAETDTMPDNYHSLWLLDERLVSFAYTASDKQLRTNKHIETNSQKEPDLLIYDFPWAYSDNPDKINALVIFEFKRPGRDLNTTIDQNFDTLIEKYFQELMKSKATNNSGRYLNIQANTPKFGYVLCDLHKELEEHNTNWNGFKRTPHNTFYKINPDVNLYIEVMSYDTMIDFAEERHNAFFKALGIDNL